MVSLLTDCIDPDAASNDFAPVPVGSCNADAAAEGFRIGFLLSIG